MICFECPVITGNFSQKLYLLAVVVLEQKAWGGGGKQIRKSLNKFLEIFCGMFPEDS